MLIFRAWNIEIQLISTNKSGVGTVGKRKNQLASTDYQKNWFMNHNLCQLNSESIWLYDSTKLIWFCEFSLKGMKRLNSKQNKTNQIICKLNRFVNWDSQNTPINNIIHCEAFFWSVFEVMCQKLGHTKIASLKNKSNKLPENVTNESFTHQNGEGGLF